MSTTLWLAVTPHSRNWLKKLGKYSKPSHVNTTTCVSLVSTSIGQMTASIFINAYTLTVLNRFHGTQTSDCYDSTVLNYHVSSTVVLMCVRLLASSLKSSRSRSTYRMWSNRILQYAASRTRAIYLSACANLIPRVCTYAPTLMHPFLPTLTTRHSSATSCYWQTCSIIPSFCITRATRVAESHDPYVVLKSTPFLMLSTSPIALKQTSKIYWIVVYLFPNSQTRRASLMSSRSAPSLKKDGWWLT